MPLHAGLVCCGPVGSFLCDTKTRDTHVLVVDDVVGVLDDAELAIVADGENRSTYAWE